MDLLNGGCILTLKMTGGVGAMPAALLRDLSQTTTPISRPAAASDPMTAATIPVELLELESGSGVVEAGIDNGGSEVVEAGMDNGGSEVVDGEIGGGVVVIVGM